MSEKWSGHGPDDLAAPADTGVAERLIREEFSDASPAHRTWFHREGKEAVAGAPNDGDVPGLAAQARSAEAPHDAVVPVVHATAEVPAVTPDQPPTDATIAIGAVAIHEAFVEPKRPPRSRSHRGGMLAGLGVVGALLAVLVVLAPGGSKPRLPAQSVHDVSPITASGPKTDAATVPPTAVPTTTSSAPASTTTTPHQSETITTFITYSLVPGVTPAVAPSPAAPAATTTTAPPTTTTTTSPPSTTTTTRPKNCILICL